MSDGSNWARYDFAFQADFTRIPELSPSEWLIWEARLGVFVSVNDRRLTDVVTSEVASYLTLRACRKPNQLDIKRKLDQFIKQAEDFLALIEPGEFGPTGTFSPRVEALSLICREEGYGDRVHRERLRDAARCVRENAEAAKTRAVRGRPLDHALRALVRVSEEIVRAAPAGARVDRTAAVDLVVALVERIAMHAEAANATTNLTSTEGALAAEAVAAFAMDAPRRITDMIGRDGRASLRRRKSKTLSIKADSALPVGQSGCL